MAEVKDKVVTVESLSFLHEHNKDTYMPKADPTGTGTMTMDGDGIFSGNLNVNSITINNGVKLEFDNIDGVIKFVFLDEVKKDEVTE